MDAQEFDKALASALRICRAAAAERLPVEEMLEYAENLLGEVDDAHSPVLPDLQFLLQTVGAFYDIVQAGKALPPESTPIRVPDAPSGAVFIPSVGFLLVDAFAYWRLKCAARRVDASRG